MTAYLIFWPRKLVLVLEPIPTLEPCLPLCLSEDHHRVLKVRRVVWKSNLGLPLPGMVLSL